MTRGLRACTAFVVSLMVMSACGAPKPAASPAAPAAPLPTGPVCAGAAGDAHAVRFPGTGGQPLYGYTIGTGSVGVVLGNQAGSTACEWLAYAKNLAQRGYRVLAFDFNGEGNSAESDGSEGDDVASAAKYLRSQPGITDVVLIGASRGGTAVLVAAANLQPAPKAVISLSAPAVFNQDDAALVVAKLTMPTLFVAAKDDGTFAGEAQLLYDKVPPANRRLTIVPGTSHGLVLVTPGLEGADEATKAIDEFLA